MDISVGQRDINDVPRAAWQMTFGEFAGPSMVGPLWSIDGADEEYDLVWEAARDGGLPALWHSACGRCVIRDLEWDQVPSLVLEADGNAVGFYLCGACWVAPEWRGLGLAVEMVLMASQCAGGSPTCNEDGLGFSEAGHQLHRKAHTIAVQRAVEAGYAVPERVLLDIQGDAWQSQTHNSPRR